MCPATVNWPCLEDYIAAINNRGETVSDFELKSSQPQVDAEQKLIAFGTTNSVFHMESDDTAYALKCFGYPCADRQRRYSALKDTILKLRPIALTDFTYITDGISIGGVWYPVLKMRWLDGLRLDEHVFRLVNDHSLDCDKSELLKQLAANWYTINCELNKYGINHGDLEPGNVIVRDCQIHLVDYDTISVPAMASRRWSAENQDIHGNEFYQQMDGHQSSNLDNFAAWIIYASLMALSRDVSGALGRFCRKDQMLFSPSDLQHPNESPVFQAMYRSGNDLQALARSIEKLYRLAPGEVPPLTDLQLDWAELWWHANVNVDKKAQLYTGQLIGRGEERAARHLERELPYPWAIVPNKELADQKSYRNVDFIVVGLYTVFILQCKQLRQTVCGNERGWIRADKKDLPSPSVDAISLCGRIEELLKELPELANRARDDEFVFGAALVVNEGSLDLRISETYGKILTLDTVVEALLDSDRLGGLAGSPRLPRDKVLNKLVGLPGRSAVPKKINAFSIVECLPNQGTVRCFLAEHSDGSVRTLKVIERPVTTDPTLRKDLENACLREYRALRELGSTGVVPEVDPFTLWDQDRYWVIPVHLVPGRTLHVDRYNSVPSEEKVLKILKAAFSSLKIIHEARVIHRTLNPSRIFILDDEETIAFSDFLVAKIIGERTVYPQSHARDPDPSFSFRPPECLHDMHLTSQRSDVYSLASSLFYWITGSEPLPCDEVATNTSFKVSRPEFDSSLATLLDSLFNRCLSAERKRRPTPQAVLKEVGTFESQRSAESGQASNQILFDLAAQPSTELLSESALSLDATMADCGDTPELTELIATAEEHCRSGNNEAALHHYSTAIKLYPLSVELLRGRANVYRAMSMVQDAINDYTSCVQIGGEAAEWSAVIADCTNILELTPDPHIYYRRAYARQQLGDLGGACADYKAAYDCLVRGTLNDRR